MKNNKLENFQKSYQRDLDTQGICCILDIYYPLVKKTLYPMIVYIHGGAFIKGDKKRYQLTVKREENKVAYARWSNNTSS